MLHAAGIFHEQSRNDRQHYVTIIEENIEERYAYNFQQRNDSLNFGTTYDYRSVMHYGPNVSLLKSTLLSRQFLNVHARFHF